jgi:hypothetical protein
MKWTLAEDRDARMLLTVICDGTMLGIAGYAVYATYGATAFGLSAAYYCIAVTRGGDFKPE